MNKVGKNSAITYNDIKIKIVRFAIVLKFKEKEVGTKSSALDPLGIVNIWSQGSTSFDADNKPLLRNQIRSATQLRQINNVVDKVDLLVGENNAVDDVGVKTVRQVFPHALEG